MAFLHSENISLNTFFFFFSIFQPVAAFTGNSERADFEKTSPVSAAFAALYRKQIALFFPPSLSFESFLGRDETMKQKAA